jgi:hypothetical protein
MHLSPVVQKTLKGKGQLLTTEDRPAIDVHYKLELSGILIESATLDGRHQRLPEWRTAKGELKLNSCDDGPLDPKVEYLLVLDGDVECRIKVRPHGRPLTYIVEGSVSKAP